MSLPQISPESGGQTGLNNETPEDICRDLRIDALLIGKEPLRAQLMQHKDKSVLAAAACAAAFVGVVYLARKEWKRWALLNSHMAQVQPQALLFRLIADKYQKSIEVQAHGGIISCVDVCIFSHCLSHSHSTTTFIFGRQRPSLSDVI